MVKKQIFVKQSEKRKAKQNAPKIASAIDLKWKPATKNTKEILKQVYSDKGKPKPKLKCKQGVKLKRKRCMWIESECKREEENELKVILHSSFHECGRCNF